MKGRKVVFITILSLIASFILVWLSFILFVNLVPQ